MLQPGNHAVGDEVVLFHLGNKEKQNDPVSDSMELPRWC